ncbi:MAG: HD domain-containing protein [Clostridiales bacterium]|nr:HD domain-containing protein [Clostridiales bacterium]
MIENINNSSSFIETLNFINQTFSAFIPYSYIGIALLDDDKRFIKASYGVSDGSIKGLPENIIGKFWELKQTSLWELVATGKPRIINDLEAYTQEKPITAYNKIIMDAGIKASITLPLMLSQEPVGIIFFSSNQKNVYTKEHIEILQTLATSIAISFKQNIIIENLIYSSIMAMAKLSEARDEDTGKHLGRIQEYSRFIAELLMEEEQYPAEIDLKFVDEIEKFSPLHDIGKVGIRDGILLKPAKLTADEFEEMKKHPLYGAEVLEAVEENIAKKGKSIFRMAIDIAKGHHEKWDGTGYPYGKKGEDIPLSARIVAVADVFDALTSKRPYKEAFSFDASLDIIRKDSGKHFDPTIVEIVLKHKERLKKLYKTLM